MTEKYILSFDIGTTNVKCGIVDVKDFNVIYKKTKPAEVIYPKNGWAEVDPEELWIQISELSREITDEGEFNAEDIKAVIYTAHMAGVLPIDKDGNPLRNIIIWLDERAKGLPKDIWRGIIKISGYDLFKLINFLRIAGGAPSKTGKDPISKILWIKNYEPDIFHKTRYFADVKGYLIFKSTGNIVTSHDEASLTWLADTRSGKAYWYKPFFKKYGINIDTFPIIMDSTDIAGKLSHRAAEELNVNADIPVIVGSGDLTSAAIGSGAVKEKEPHIYIGTSDWIAAHISRRKVDIFHYIGSLFSGIPRKYLLIAEQEVATGALEWFMDVMDIGEKNYDKVDELVRSSSPGSNNLLFFPWLYGERTPIDDPNVRGGLINFSFKHSKGDLFRSIMEGVSLNIRWAYEYFIKIVGNWDVINIVGGGALFDIWCQILSDTLGIRLRRIRDPNDTGLRGNATIATVALGFYKNFEEAVKRYSVDRIFNPNHENKRIYDKLYTEFKDFYKKNRGLYASLNR